MDYAEAFAVKQNASTIGSIEEDKGNVGIKAAANVRFSADAEAAIVVCTATDPRTQSAGDLKIAKLKRKFTEVFLDTSKPLPDKQNVRFVDRTGSFTAGEEETQSIRQWLTEHKEITPIAGVGANRTRFAGLHNTSSGGIWATLDRDIFMKESLIKDLANDDWTQTALPGAAMFPHAILEVRREGNQAGTLIQILDRSHLVSLAMVGFHAISTNIYRSSVSVVSRSRPMLYGLVAGQAPCLPLTGSLFLTKTFVNYQNQ